MPKILIIDDDQSVRGLLRRRLENLYEIFDTGNPEEALSMALQLKPDCILLDLTMPKFSGFELCQTLTSLSYTQQIPILIISGEPSAQHWASCQKLGAAGYFEKPLNFDELNARLAAVFDSGRTTPRGEVRLRLRETLKLKGTDADGKTFDVAIPTINISASGFRCMCTFKVKKDSVVEVFTANDREQYVGEAHVVWVEWHNTDWPIAGLRFVDKPTSCWVLQ